MFEDVISYRNEGVFLTVHSTVLINEGQTVNIGIDDESYVAG